MTAVVKVKQRRADRLGASDAPVVLNFIGSKSPMDVWLRITGRVPPDPANDAMQFGTEYEPIIRGRYVNLTHTRVWVPSESLLHPSLDFLQATPDGVCIRDIVPDSSDLTAPENWSHGLEVKAPRARQRPDWGDSTVPQHVLVQVAVQMAVTGLPFTDVVAEIDREYIQRRVHRDAELEATVLEGLANFWGYVKRDTPPPIDASESYGNHLRKKLADATETIDASPEIAAVCERWKQAEIDLKNAKERIDLAKNHVMAAMLPANAGCVLTPIGRIYMQAGKVDYDDKAFAQELCNRLQLRGEAVDFDAERQRFRKQGNPFPRRPNAWTKE